jgi:hypothetical protein
MHHRLIAFAGSGCGAGKSVLSSWLCSALETRGISARLVTEGGAFGGGFGSGALQPFAAAMEKGDPFFAWVDHNSHELLNHMPGEKLLLDTTDVSLGVIEQRLLDHLGLLPSV